jgi:hypothetical protein
MYRLAMQFIGPESRQGREFTNLWQYKEFRHVFQVITVVWGAAYLIEAAVRIVIVQETTAGTALTVSKILPYAVAAVLVAWNVAYGRRQKRRGERLAAAAAGRTAVGDTHAAGSTSAESPPAERRGPEAT